MAEEVQVEGRALKDKGDDKGLKSRIALTLSTKAISSPINSELAL
jgi:hypothetical protein